jgi:hypothetical protein
MTQSTLRALAGVLTVLALAACDARESTGGGDSSPPSISLSATGANADSANVATPFPVTLTAGDNLSLLRVRLNAVVGNDIRVVLDTTFHAATPTYVRNIGVALTGAVAGQVVRITAVADDGSGNTNLDSLLVVVVDPEAPTVSVSSPAAAAQLRAGGPVNITVNADDQSGLARVGYEFLSIGDGGVEKVYSRDSVSLAPGITTIARSFARTVPDSLQPGAFQIRGFAVDRTGNRALSPTVTVTVQDVVKPAITITSPPLDSNITVASNVIVESHITDNSSLARYSVVGIATRGDPSLGIVDTIIRYDSTFAPVNVGGKAAQFRDGLRDTTIRRLLTPKNNRDSTVEAILFVARVTDVSGNETVATQRAQLVSGPVIKVLKPGANPVSAPGKSIVIQLRAVDHDGVKTLGYRTVSPSFNVTKTAPAAVVPKDTMLFTDTLVVPGNFPTNTSFAVVPFATDNLNQPGSGQSLNVAVLSPIADAAPPLVFQTINPRVESTDSVTIRAVDPSGISSIGYVMLSQTTGGVVRTDSVSVVTAFTDVQQSVQLRVPVSFAGQRVVVRSFARDANGNKGWSLPSNAQIPQPNQALARADTVLVVYGRTYALPNGGVAADIAVDPLRRAAYVSNLTFDRLEVWQAAADAFNAKKIAVGSDPWGMIVDNSGDTLLVANSGGTNISRVFIGSASIANVNEVTTRRLKTPNAHIFDVTVQINNGIARYKRAIYDFSDRPQYIAQTIDGTIYYSTKPTTEAPAGTIRRYDPTLVSPDVQIITDYAGGTGTENVSVVNVDDLGVIITLLPPGDTTQVSDSLVICDHPYGTANASQCFVGVTLAQVATALRGIGSDIQLISGFDITSLGLTDTTFVAVGGDRRWVAFGEGATPTRAGRIMMARSPGDFFSPSTSVNDLTNNAAERLFGLAINSNSSSVAARGNASYFAEIADPFHLRLQGKFSTVFDGAGVVFHPLNVGDTPSLDDPTRVAFVASADGTIQIVDSFHYTSRGTLAVRSNLYGPLRAALPFAGDDPTIVVKLFGLTPEGLVVIDIRAADIKPLSGG